jgi:hypothetical protein
MCQRCGLQIFSQIILQIKHELFNLYMFNVICMWHVPCVVHWSIICNSLLHVYSNSWVPDVPHCLMKHVGASLRGRAWKKWYVSWAMIWSRHIEGRLTPQNSIHHIDVEKCALWTLPSGKELYIKPSKISLKRYYNGISLQWVFVISYQTTSLASLTTKHVGPYQYINKALKYVLTKEKKFNKVETPYHDNDLILTPIISPQSGWQWTWSCSELHICGFRDGGWKFLTFGRCH